MWFCSYFGVVSVFNKKLGWCGFAVKMVFFFMCKLDFLIDFLLFAEFYLLSFICRFLLQIIYHFDPFYSCKLCFIYIINKYYRYFDGVVIRIKTEPQGNLLVFFYNLEPIHRFYVRFQFFGYFSIFRFSVCFLLAPR